MNKRRLKRHRYRGKQSKQNRTFQNNEKNSTDKIVGNVQRQIRNSMQKKKKKAKQYGRKIWGRKELNKNVEWINNLEKK